MTSALDVAPPDPQLYALLREEGFGDEVFNPRQHRTCELVERYTRALATGLVDALGLGDALARGASVDELVAATAFVPAFRPALAWLVEYVASVDPPGTTTDVLRATILDMDASYAPALALLDEAAAIYPCVARGETTGEHALFRRAALWFAYFSNENGYYAINNRVAAAAAAGRCRPGARVLEIGAGLGSATEALLARLGPAAGSLATYRATEPVALFRRRAERNLRAARPDVPFVFDALDANEAWDVPPGSFDLVWGVNVFHLARELERVLGEACRALAPGGWLVAGEGLRPAPERPVGAELPFRLLESFTDVELDPERRPTPGFLTAETWCAAFARAGFVHVTLVPDAVRVRALYPGLFAAGVCGQAG